MIFLEQLDELMESRSLVDVHRDDLEADCVRGYVLATSAKLIMIGVVGDDIHHDGYSIIDLDHVTFLRWGTDRMLGWERVLGGPQGDGIAKDADLSSWWGAIEAARAASPLVAFFIEEFETSGCYISDKFQFSDTTVVGRQVSDDGRRNGFFALRTDDLTRIDFGGRYESGLFRMLETA